MIHGLKLDKLNNITALSPKSFSKMTSQIPMDINTHASPMIDFHSPVGALISENVKQKLAR